MQAATQAVKRALEQHRKLIVDRCVAPSLAKKPLPAKVNLTFNGSFDANGKQVARGLSEDRETGRADVTSCVQLTLPALTIAAPGGPVYVDGIVWTLP